MARKFMELTKSEVQTYIPYHIVCETRYGARWETGKRKRLWKSAFTAKESEAATKLFAQAHKWVLSTGVPETVLMSMDTFELWLKLGDFCYAL